MTDFGAREPEAKAIAGFLSACEAGIGPWVHPHRRTECALTRACITPYHRMASIGAGAFVREDAVRAISIRGNESVADVLQRFAWASREVAAEWVAAGDDVLLLSSVHLRPRMILAVPRFVPGGCSLEQVTSLYWRGVAFMLRRSRE